MPIDHINGDMSVYTWFLYARELAHHIVGIFVAHNAPSDDTIIDCPFLDGVRCVVYRMA